MARIVPTALVAFLLAGTATAFALTERLKLVRTPITGPRVDKVLSPVCGCPTADAGVRFRLRRADRVTLAIVDEQAEVVRTLFAARPLEPRVVRASWDGRDDAGAVVPDGVYRPRVRLHDERRTIVLPAPMEVDTTPPRSIRLLAVGPRAFSPDGDGRRDRVVVRYVASERVHPILYVRGTRAVRGGRRRAEGELQWFGRAGGGPLPAGQYRLTLRAEDAAGNVSEPSAPAWVEIRYAALRRDVIRVRTGARFAARVRTDAASYRWRFAGRGGVATGSRLVLRAPRAPGRYRLFVEANGRGDGALVVVTRGR